MPFSDVLKAFILFVRYELGIKFPALIIWLVLLLSIAISHIWKGVKQKLQRLFYKETKLN